MTLSNTTTIWGQGVGINSTNSTPDASAMLDVKSSDKGVLIPRMTTVQRTAIASPATGLLVFDNTSTSFWFYNGVAWTELGGESLFTKTGTTIQPNTTIINETTDDFVFGAIHLEDDGDANHDNRLFFDKSKGAFRAGTVTDTEWDDVNVGINSTAFGKNNVSSGDYSAAFGRETTSSGLHSISSGLLTRAIGTYSTTKGYNTEASGSYSSAAGNYTEASADGANAWGTHTEASGVLSTAWGRYTDATGSSSTAWGTHTDATGTYATAWGRSTDATGTGATAWGDNAVATRDYSTAWGVYASAYGTYSTAWGGYTEAFSAYETTLGAYNTSYTATSTTGWDASDRLFTLGNGTSATAKHNALTIYKDGTMNINDAYNMPTTDGLANQVMTTNGAGVATWTTLSTGTDDQNLTAATLTGNNLQIDIEGGSSVTADLSSLQIFAKTGNLIHVGSTVDETSDDFVFGSTQLADDGSTTHDHRFSFDKSKGAFRAGEVTGNQWNDATVGDNSIALGYNTTASGFISTAFGNATTASGQSSTALGSGNVASGTNATAWGYFTDATGTGTTSFGLWTLASASYATAWGRSSTASGSYSTAFGSSTTSSGSYSTAFGNNTTSSGGYSTTWGNNTSAPSGYETTIGQYNTTYTPTATTSWDANDRLFTIGNGTSNTARADAFTVLKNGFVGIGVSTPASDLHIKCTSTAEAGSGGITLETTNNTNNWRVYHSGLYCSFAENGVRRAYVQNGTGTWIVVSDGNRKKNINNLENVLGKVNQLRPVTYHYKDQKDSDQKVTGFVAQEVEKIFPDMVSYDEDGNIGMGYAQFGILSIAAVKEQQQLIDKQQSEIDQLKNEIQEIKKLLK